MKRTCSNARKHVFAIARGESDTTSWFKYEQKVQSSNKDKRRTSLSGTCVNLGLFFNTSPQVQTKFMGSLFSHNSGCLVECNSLRKAIEVVYATILPNVCLGGVLQFNEGLFCSCSRYCRPDGIKHVTEGRHRCLKDEMEQRPILWYNTDVCLNVKISDFSCDSSNVYDLGNNHIASKSMIVKF